MHSVNTHAHTHMHTCMHTAQPAGIPSLPQLCTALRSPHPRPQSSTHGCRVQSLAS